MWIHQRAIKWYSTRSFHLRASRGAYQEEIIIGQLHFSRSSGRCNRPKNSLEGCTTLGGNPHGESSSSGVNQVKRDNVSSHGHSVGRRHQRKRCFRCGWNNHTPEHHHKIWLSSKYIRKGYVDFYLQWSLFLPIKTQISMLKQLIVFF